MFLRDGVFVKRLFHESPARLFIVRASPADNYPEKLEQLLGAAGSPSGSPVVNGGVGGGDFITTLEKLRSHCTLSTNASWTIIFVI